MVCYQLDKIILQIYHHKIIIINVFCDDECDDFFLVYVYWTYVFLIHPLLRSDLFQQPSSQHTHSSFLALFLVLSPVAHLTISATVSRLHTSRALLLRIRLAAARANLELSRIQSSLVHLFALWLVSLIPVCALALLAAVAH
jgi:hypothetical protein